jgi:hypothetical protein
MTTWSPSTKVSTSQSSPNNITQVESKQPMISITVSNASNPSTSSTSTSASTTTQLPLAGQPSAKPFPKKAVHVPTESKKMTFRLLEVCEGEYFIDVEQVVHKLPI